MQHQKQHNVSSITKNDRQVDFWKGKPFDAMGYYEQNLNPQKQWYSNRKGQERLKNSVNMPFDAYNVNNF